MIAQFPALCKPVKKEKGKESREEKVGGHGTVKTVPHAPIYASSGEASADF